MKLRSIHAFLLLTFSAVPALGQQFNLQSTLNPANFGQTFVISTDSVNFTGFSNPQNIVFKANGVFFAGVSTDSTGVGKISVPSITPGTIVFTACVTSQPGGGNNIACSNPFNQVVNKVATSTAVASSASTSTFGQSVTFTATLTAPVLFGTTFASGNVSFFLDGSAGALGTVNLANDLTAKLVVSNVPAGQHSIVARYNGDTNFAASTSTAITQTVNNVLTPTSITLTSTTPNPSTTDQVLTLTATISPNTVNGGITLFDGGTQISEGVISGNGAPLGAAFISASRLSQGTHALTARFAGNSTFAASISNTLNQVVIAAPSRASTTTLTSSINPSSVGQQVTFTAIPRSVVTGDVAFGGTVTFFDGATQLGAIPNGLLGANLSTSTLSAGSHSITAQFAGSEALFGSTSAVLTQVVNAAGNGCPTVAVPATSSTGVSAGDFNTGSTLMVTASGEVRLATDDQYSTQADGVITKAPTAGTPAFGFFSTLPPVGPPVVGGTKTLNGFPIGALLGAFGPKSAATPTTAFFLIGSAFSMTVPDTGASGGSRLFLKINDNAFGDNSGQFTAALCTSATGGGALTIGSSPSQSAFGPQGQSFTPAVTGNRGVGTPPASGSLFLTTFTFDFQTPGSAPQFLFIYASPPSVAQVNNNGQGSLATGVNNGAGVYAFNNLALDVNTKYFAVLSAPASIFEASTNPYTGGADMFAQGTPATNILEGGNFDTGFTATFQTSTLPANTVTILSASPVTSATGQAVTLTATVQPITATGSVDFMEGNTILGTANLNLGVATFSTSTLAAGTHSLFAFYKGSTRFAQSLSTAFNQTVTAVPLSGAWTVTQSHINDFSAGQPFAIFTITIMNTGTAPTAGAVAVSNFSPVGAVLSGANWNCPPAGSTCSRSDSLPVGGAYPPITAVINLSTFAGNTVSNQVTVTGGGLTQGDSTNTANLRPAFTDVPSTDLFLPAIDLLRESGITTGCSPTAYCGNDTITQAQMAVFVVRSVMGNDNFTFPSTPFFTDVPATNLFFKWIQKMQDLGIALSCGGAQFCPDSPVTRSQMAVLIIRARYSQTTPPNVPATPAFTDVLATDAFFPFVQKMKQVGITTGCSPTTYCGDTPVTRGQMAVFIMRGMFNLLLPAGTPQLSLSSGTLLLGQNITITVQGQNTNFVTGVTQVSAGAGVTITSTTVINSTTMTVRMVVNFAATRGPRSLVITTGAEEATAVNGLFVTSF